MSTTRPTTFSTEIKDAGSERYQRYKSVIGYIANQTSFALADAKLACPKEKPAFVTRLVNELEQTGWVVRESPGSSVFRWNLGRGPFCVQRWLDEKLFGTQVKVAPEQERPRERLLKLGPEKLRTADLLAILIRSGRPGESAVMAGEKLANQFQSHLEDLPAAGRAELKSISPAIHVTAYCQIMAGIELGRRIAALSDKPLTHKIASTQEAIQFCRQYFSRLAEDAKQEEFHIVTLDTKNQVIDTHQISVGTLDASLVHPREVFRAAIKDAASSILLLHNHPSGDPTPSREDLRVTKRLEACGETLGIRVLDHIVIGAKGGVSIREYVPAT